MAQPLAPGRTAQSGGVSIAVLIALVACVLIVCAAALAGLYLLRGDSAAASDEHNPTAEKPAPEPIFVSIKPFTINLKDDVNRILHVELSLRVASKDEEERIQVRMPQLRDRILITLTDADARSLVTHEGKKKLASDLLARLSEPFDTGDKPLAIEQVLFTNFIVQ